MGKPTGFIEYLRELPVDRTPTERFMPKATRATVDFLFDGQRLVPTPAAKEWVEKLPGPYR